MQSLKNKELDCIRFYMGDPSVQDKFCGGLKAYNTINALLHSGIQNELDLLNENRKIEIYDIHHLKQYIDIILSIYQSMISYHNNHKNTHLISYKIDRYSSITQMLNNQKIEGFFSTCKYGYLEEYAHIKKDVVLLEIIRDEDVPYLDFECLFQEKYVKPEEAEILIPFDTKVSMIQEIELSKLEKELNFDMNGNAPIGKYRIYLEQEKKDIQEIDESVLYQEFDRVQTCISNIKNLKDEDLKFYINWKENLRNYFIYKLFK